MTISLPLELMRDARPLAVDCGLSFSAFVAALIEEQIESRRQRAVALERAMDLMRKGYELGLGEKIPWSRDELHEC